METATRTVVLVEGTSDAIALSTLARRLGRDLRGDGVEVVSIGGAQAVRRAVIAYESTRLVGLCDAREAPEFARVLDARCVFVCHGDLEDELIRALGAARVQEVVAAHGDLGAFRTLQKQPEWRDRPVEEQLRRFFGSGARRKIRYAQFLVEALDLDHVPAPLTGVLQRV
jgi:hypothetical protein